MKRYEDGLAALWTDDSVLLSVSCRNFANKISGGHILRKEVIQPQVPLRLPCYDFTPVTDHTVAGFLPCGLAHRLRVEPTPMV